MFSSWACRINLVGDLEDKRLELGLTDKLLEVGLADKFQAWIDCPHKFQDK